MLLPVVFLERKVEVPAVLVSRGGRDTEEMEIPTKNLSKASLIQ